jgi:putative ABC transport system permease protein
MSDLRARVRVFAGQLALLGALALVAALLVSGVPKAANDISDRALRRDIAALPYTGRDLIFRTSAIARPDIPVNPTSSVAFIRGELPPLLSRLIGAQWFEASSGPEKVLTRTPAGVVHQLGLRAQNGVQEASRLTAGRWPATSPRAAQVEIALSTDVADRMGVVLDTVLAVNGATSTVVEVVVVGLFEPLDRSAPIWADAGQVLRQDPGIPDLLPPSAIALTDPQGLAIAATGLGTITHTWRFRIDERRLDAGMIDAVAVEVNRLRDIVIGPRLQASTGLDDALVEFAGETSAARALLAVAGGGLVCTLLGLIWLAARLAVQRRREEFALVRARGGSVLAIGGRVLAESAVVLPATVVAGWLLGQLPPGRPPGTGWLLVLVGALTVTAVPGLAMAGQYRLPFARRRMDLVAWRPSARRLTGELSVLGLAALGTYLLRRRGLSHGGVDPFLVCVPVLLAAAAALLALRIAPWPLRQASRLAARARGALAFIGLARVGRGGPAVAGPLAVLVVAITTGVFCLAVATTVDDARDRATVAEIPADALLTGYRFGPQTADQLAAVPGVTAVAAVVDYPSVLVRPSGGGQRYSRVVVIDAGAFRRVVERSGVDAQLPPELMNARRGADGVVPAVVSPEVAAQVHDRGRVQTDDGFDFTVAAVADSVPGLGAGAKNFIVLPWQALPPKPSGAPFPNRFLVAGHGYNVDTLRQVADQGQRAFFGSGTGNLSQPSEVTIRTQRRSAMESTGANQLLTFAFVAGTVGGVVLALLAIGFAVLAEASSRGRALSRLRTMGLSARQGRRLLVYELAPLLGLAVLSGAVVGVLLPRLLGPSLGLDAFTAGVAASTYLDPVLVGSLLGLVVVAVAAAIGFESLVNRRMRLGEVLRLGEEN